jgi:putative FmdB family regulatory protein
MPTYDYECRKCGHKFEYFKTMSEPDPKNCPVCKGKLKRLIGTGAGIIFKGSGFYETDYRKKKSKNEESGASKESSKPAEVKPTEACKTCPGSQSGTCPKDKQKGQ